MTKKKKKSWVERLIELLNEYAYGEHKELYYRDGEMVEINSAMVISKKFWFIKWLVDNDKIDRYKFEIEYIDKQTLEDVYIAVSKQDELLTIILSISDTPIEDLISYLK